MADAKITEQANGCKTIDVPIRQQDGSIVVLKYRDTVHNRMLADFIRRHEPFQ